MVRHLGLASLLSLAAATFAYAVMPPGMTVVATIDVPTAKPVLKMVTLAAPSHSVYMGAIGHIFCEYVRLHFPDGSKSTAFLDSDLPDKKGMTQGAPAGQNYVAVEISCHGTPSGQLVLAVPGK